MIVEQDIFEELRLLERTKNENGFTQKLLVLGFMHYTKLDHCEDILERDPNAGLSLQDIEDILNGFTDRDHEDFNAKAKNSLDRYAEKNPVRHLLFDWFFGVVQGVSAAAVWSALLVAVLLYTKYYGIDVVHALGLDKTVEGSATPGTGTNGDHTH